MTLHLMTVFQGDTKRPRQYGLGGLFLLFVGAAAGLSAFTPGRWKLGECLLNAAIVWIILGLVHQVYDLWTAYRGAELTTDERCGWRYAALWRVVVALLLAAYCVVNTLVSKQILVLPKRNSGLGALLLWAVLCVSLLAVLGSVPRRLAQRRTSSWSRCGPSRIRSGRRTVRFCRVGKAHFAVVCSPGTDFHRVGAAATFCARGPTIFRLREGQPLPSLRNNGLRREFGESYAGNATAAVLAPRAMGPLDAGEPLGFGIVPFSRLSCLALECGHGEPFAVLGRDTRNRARISLGPRDGALGFPGHPQAHHASPLPARASEPGEARTPVPGAVPGKASWRRRAGCYYHERFAVLAFLLVALTAFPVADLVSDLYHIFGPSRFKIRISGPLDLLWLIPSPLDASACFHTAVLLATIGALRATRHSPDEIHSADPQPLPPGRFAAAWAAQFLALVLGFPAFIAFAFGMTLVFY